MTNLYRIRRFALLVALVALFAFSSSGASAQSNARGGQKTTAPPAPQDSSPLIIDTVSLPGTHPGAIYLVHLQVRGGTAPFHWKLESGELPAGIKLADDGTLRGTLERAGEFRFSISVRDSGSPQQAVQREYVLSVVAALSMQWKTPAHVSVSRIEGSVVVSNTTSDDFDFTFVVLAVDENGRATAIGYQRFPLKKGTMDFEIPFGENLAHGAYVVHVDGVGEIAKKNQIHRARLQTPAALQVVAGP